MNFEEKIQTARAAEYKRGYAAGRKSLEPDWVSASLRQPERDGIYFAVLQNQDGSCSIGLEAVIDTWQNRDGSCSIGLYEMYAGGSWLVDGKTRKVIYWAEPTRFDLPEELRKKGIA